MTTTNDFTTTLDSMAQATTALAASPLIVFMAIMVLLLILARKAF